MLDDDIIISQYYDILTDEEVLKELNTDELLKNDLIKLTFENIISA